MVSPALPRQRAPRSGTEGRWDRDRDRPRGGEPSAAPQHRQGLHCPGSSFFPAPPTFHQAWKDTGSENQPNKQPQTTPPLYCGAIYTFISCLPLCSALFPKPVPHRSLRGALEVLPSPGS